MSQEENSIDPRPTLDQTLNNLKTVSGQVREGLERAREADMPLGISAVLPRRHR
jgi:hypothetical protein